MGTEGIDLLGFDKRLSSSAVVDAPLKFQNDTTILIPNLVGSTLHDFW